MDLPVCRFKDNEQLREYAKWWQEKLFLTDWFISCSLVHATEMGIEGADGENLLIFENKEATIHILHFEECKPSPFTFCQEKILVHELLHCLYNYANIDEDSYAERHLDMIEHQRLEEMARSLIMIKYNISRDWFLSE